MLCSQLQAGGVHTAIVGAIREKLGDQLVELGRNPFQLDPARAVAGFIPPKLVPFG